MVRCARTVTSELFFNFPAQRAVFQLSRAAALCSEIVEVSGGLRKSLPERLERFKSFFASVKDRCNSLRLCSTMPASCSAVAMLACCSAIHVHCAFRSLAIQFFKRPMEGPGLNAWSLGA